MSPTRMAKLKPYFKTRPKARSGQPPPAAPAPAAPQAQAAISQPVAPQPSQDLGSRREQLARRYAELQADLGGLVYEMAIRDSFRLDVVTRRAAELQAVDAELSAVERQLGLAPPPVVTACPSCAAPVQPGARFCGSCGSTVNAVAAPPGSG